MAYSTSSLEFCSTLRELYESRQLVGRSGRKFTMKCSLSTINNIVTIRQIMMESNPHKTLEIGMAYGGSALTFAATHRDLQHVPEQQHVAIDGFQKSFYDDIGRLMLEKSQLEGYVKVIEQLSSFGLAKLAEDDGKFDLIYVDGSHTFEDVFCDFYFAHELLNVGGYVLFDDSADKEVASVIRFVQKNLRNAYQQISITRYRPPSFFNKLKYRTGELFHITQLTIFRKISDARRTHGSLRRF